MPHLQAAHSQAATAQKEKLAALKHWSHYSGFERAAWKNLNDDLMYNILYGVWDGTDQSKPLVVTTTSDPLFSVASTAVGKASDGPRRLNDLFEDDDEMEGVDVDAINATLDEIEGEHQQNVSAREVGGAKRRSETHRIADTPQSSPEPNEPIFKRPKISRGNEDSSARMLKSVGLVPDGERKYNLMDIAEATAGRVMYIFEKMSNSKIGEV